MCIGSLAPERRRAVAKLNGNPAVSGGDFSGDRCGAAPGKNSINSRQGLQGLQVGRVPELPDSNLSPSLAVAKTFGEPCGERGVTGSVYLIITLFAFYFSPISGAGGEHCSRRIGLK